MRVRLDLDIETTKRLIEEAVKEQRPVHWQAEVILRRALGLSFPGELDQASGEHSEVRQKADEVRV